MSSGTVHGEGSAGHSEVRYDLSDLSARGIYIFLVGLAVGTGIIVLLIWGLTGYFSRRETQAVKPRTEVAVPARVMSGDPAQRFPAPRLQPDPVSDLNRFRAQEEERLDSYGWVDEKAGVVHIPIERAIELLAEHGLPVRPAPESAAKAETRRP
jgi:hypothetical protein